jgi:hypothetical protein
MKRLSFFRLTRVLPASIALSGIAALVGCINPTMNSYDTGANAGRRGSLTGGDAGGSGVVVAGGPGAVPNGVVPAGGFADTYGSTNAGQRGGLLSGGGGWSNSGWSGGPVVDGGYEDGGCASGNCGRGSLTGGRGGVMGSIDHCAQVAPGALPAQLGASVRAYHKVQKENADLDKYVVYLHEWYQNGTELGPWGRNHLLLISKRLAAVNVPVIVQASPDAQLNDFRRQRIVDVLSRIGVPGVPDIDARVVVGFPEALDLDGNMAAIIYYQSLIPSQYQNNGFGGSNFGNFGSFSGSSFGNGGFGGGGFGAGVGFGGGGFGRPFGF